MITGSRGNSLPRIRAGQAVWAIVALAGTALWVAGPASQWERLQTVCRPISTCQQYQLDTQAAHTLSAHGISLGMYAGYTVVALTLIWLMWYGLAGLIAGLR